LFAYDQVLLSDSEDDLQRTLHTLHNITKQFGMKICPLKSKVMGLKRQIPMRSKIVLDNTISKQVNIFTYFGSKISYEGGKDIT
jgi:hypothetical protein